MTFIIAWRVVGSDRLGGIDKKQWFTIHGWTNKIYSVNFNWRPLRLTLANRMTKICAKHLLVMRNVDYQGIYSNFDVSNVCIQSICTWSSLKALHNQRSWLLHGLLTFWYVKKIAENSVFIVVFSHFVSNHENAL